MGITACKEISPNRSGEVDLYTARKYQRIFYVVTDDASVTANYILINASCVPSIGATFSANGDTDTTVIVSNVRATQQEVDNPFFWLVYVDYTPVSITPATAFDIEWVEEKFQKPYSVAYNILTAALDVPVQNSAKDPFDPAPQKDDTRIGLIIQRYNAYDVLYETEMFDYQDAVNSDTYHGFSAGTCKVNISMKKVTVNLVDYYFTKYHVQIRREGWDDVVLDIGYRQLDSAALGGKSTIRDSRDGAPYSGGHPLDGAGHRLAAGGTPVYRTFRPYKRLPFATLGIGF